MTEPNLRGVALGPFYTAESVARYGVEVTSDLITLETSDNKTIYPHAQFDVGADGTIQRREQVLRLWE